MLTYINKYKSTNGAKMVKKNNNNILPINSKQN